MMGRTTAGRGRATGTASKTGGVPDTGIGPPRTSCSKLNNKKKDRRKYGIPCQGRGGVFTSLFHNSCWGLCGCRWRQVEPVLTGPSPPPSLSNAPRLISPPCYKHNKQEHVSLPTLQITNLPLFALLQVFW